MPEVDSRDASVVNRLGRRIFVRTDDVRGRHLISANGDFNPGSVKLWSEALRLDRWQFVVDVGSNYGEMLADVHMPAGAQIVAFEPSERVLPYLRRTIQELPFPVDLRPMAVSSRVGPVSFADDTEWSGMSAIVSSAEIQSERYRLTDVVATTIDNEFANTHVRSICMKIDVEGHDLEVLQGAEKTIRGADAAAIMVEILHMSAIAVADLAREWPLYLQDTRTGCLVRVPGGDGNLIDSLRSRSWLGSQDALILTGRVRPLDRRI